MKYEIINGAFQIVEFDKVMEECKAFIEREGNTKLVITDDNAKKAAKASRTAIRKKKDEIADLRKSLNTAYMGTFNEQARTLEKMLDEADETIKANITAYENIGKAPEPPVFTIKVSSYDEKAIEKVKALAVKLGCGVK